MNTPALFIVCTTLLFCKIGYSDVTRIMAPYTIREGDTFEGIAQRVAPHDMQPVVAHELQARLGSLDVGKKVMIPVYKQYKGSRTFDNETWKCAIRASILFKVHPALLVAIRNHENPQRYRDSKACGVLGMDRRGKISNTRLMQLFRQSLKDKQYPNPLPNRVWNTSLQIQMYACAFLLSELYPAIKKHMKHEYKQPTREYVYRLGRIYAEGSTHWGKCVWRIYQEATGG